jgi:hypothetical protein
VAALGVKGAIFAFRDFEESARMGGWKDLSQASRKTHSTPLVDF